MPRIGDVAAEVCFFSEEEAGVRGCEEGVRVGGWLPGRVARCREISDGFLVRRRKLRLLLGQFGKRISGFSTIN